MGLKEDDMITMLKMESHVWSPLYFALEQYISVQSGLLGYKRQNYQLLQLSEGWCVLFGALLEVVF